MDAEDVLVEASQSGAHFVHGKRVGGEVDEARVLGKGKESSSRVETDVSCPAAEIGRRSSCEIVMDSSKVEVPAVASISCLHECILEECSPLGAEDVVLEVVVDRIVASFGVESLQEVEVLPHFSECFMVVLIHRSSVDAEVASDLIEVVARGCQRHLPADSVSSEGGHRDLVLVHEPRHVICITSIILATSSQPNSSE